MKQCEEKDCLNPVCLPGIIVYNYDINTPVYAELCVKHREWVFWNVEMPSLKQKK